MAATVSAKFLASFEMTVTNQIATGINAPVNVYIPSDFAPTALATGSTAGTVSAGWVDRRTYSATPTTLDLTTLAAAATNTGASSIAKGVVILLRNNETADSGKDMTIGNAATNQFLFNGLSSATATFVVKAGCSVLITDLSSAGMPVSGSAKSVKLDPGVNNVDFTFAIAGR